MSTHCEFCKDKGRTPTDLWNSDTAAVWEPCILCSKDELVKFYEAKDDEERIAWFKGKL